MKVTIELIDELRSRVNISYEDAKKILERNDGDIIKSIIEIENSRSRRTVKSNRHRIKNSSFDNFLKSLLSLRFKITKANLTLLNIPVVLVILIVWLSFWVSLGLILLAIFTSCRFKFYTIEYEDKNVNNNFKKNVYNKDNNFYNSRNKDNINNKENEDDENEIIIE